MVLRRIAKLLGVAVLALVVLLVAGYLTGVLGLPTVEVSDRGDWGNTTENETEVITTLNVSNPNPIGIRLGEGFAANYSVDFNGVRLITGERDEIAIPRGDSTVELVSTVDNRKIVPWWREYVRNDETIDLEASGEVEISALISKTVSLPAYEQTVLADQQPVVDAFSAAVQSMEGNYSKTAGVTEVGYQIRDANASWGSVTEAYTILNVDFRIHNSGDVAVPMVPEGFRMNAEANDIALFEAGRGSMSPKSVDEDATLVPGETRTVTYAVNLTNGRVDDWFLSHIERDEHTTLQISPQLVFEVGVTGTEFAIPQDGAGYTCELQTALLVDDQQTETTCGSGGGLAG